jgi:hypothetical protein
VASGKRAALLPGTATDAGARHMAQSSGCRTRRPATPSAPTQSRRRVNPRSVRRQALEASGIRHQALRAVPLPWGPIAQRSEPPAHNRLDPGSNPGGPTTPSVSAVMLPEVVTGNRLHRLHKWWQVAGSGSRTNPADHHRQPMMRGARGLLALTNGAGTGRSSDHWNTQPRCDEPPGQGSLTSPAHVSVS